MTRKEKTGNIRKALRDLGWSNRQVSVRGSGCTNSGSLEVMIKDLSIPISVVREIAMRHEKIDRCPISGDILSGGNTFVTVGYDHNALAVRVDALDELIAATMADVERGTQMDLPGGWIVWEGCQGRWNAHPRHFDVGIPDVSCYGRRFCAKQIVILRLDDAGKSGGSDA